MSNYTMPFETRSNGTGFSPNLVAPELTASKPADRQNYFYQHGHRLQENGYCVVRLRAGEQYPAACTLCVNGEADATANWTSLRSWQEISNFNPDVTEHWSESSVGIATGEVVAIEIDAMDETAVNMIQRLTTEKLGYTPLIRQGQVPKLLMVYRTNIPFGKISCGKIGAIANGQHFVAFGNDALTRKPYEWSENSLVGLSDPTNIDVDELPLVTAQQLRELFAELSQKQYLIYGGLVGKVTHVEADGDWLTNGRFKDYYIGSPDSVLSAAMSIPNNEFVFDEGYWGGWHA